MGLDDPTTKMSKSSSTAAGHAVLMGDDDPAIRKAFKRAVTDSGREIEFSEDPEKAGVNNLLTIYQALTGRSQDEVLADFEDARGYGDLKSRVADVAIELIGPLRDRAKALLEAPEELDRLLAVGAGRAAAVADDKMAEVRERIGFLGVAGC